MIYSLSQTNGTLGYVIPSKLAQSLGLNNTHALLSGQWVWDASGAKRVAEHLSENGLRVQRRSFAFEWRSDEDGSAKLKVDHWQLAELLTVLPPLESPDNLMTASHVYLSEADAQRFLDCAEKLSIGTTLVAASAGLSRKILAVWPYEVDSLCVTYHESRSFYDRDTGQEVSIFHLTPSTWGKVTYIREVEPEGSGRRRGTCTLRHFAQAFSPYDPRHRSSYVSEDLRRYAATGEHRLITSYDDAVYLDAALVSTDVSVDIPQHHNTPPLRLN